MTRIKTISFSFEWKSEKMSSVVLSTDESLGSWKKDEEELNTEDVDELIEYSKKFQRKLKSELNVTDETEVSDFSENSLVNLPVWNEKRWAGYVQNVVEKFEIEHAEKQEMPNSPKPIIEIFQRSPEKTKLIQEEKPLKEKVTHEKKKTHKSVRNAGVNVNFIRCVQSVQAKNTEKIQQKPKTEVKTLKTASKPTTPKRPDVNLSKYTKLSKEDLRRTNLQEFEFKKSKTSVFPKRQRIPKDIGSTKDNRQIKVLRFSETPEFVASEKSQSNFSLESVGKFEFKLKVFNITRTMYT